MNAGVHPFWSSDNGETTLHLYHGHVLDVLRLMPAESVHCVVTSPPYWGLRDYKLAPQVWGGNSAECGHEWSESLLSPDHGSRHGKGASILTGGRHTYDDLPDHERAASSYCLGCGAWQGSLGAEPTPDLYVQHLVEVFRETRRVLRKDGTVWLNMGDGYSSGDRATYRSAASDNKGHLVQNDLPRPLTPRGLKPKDLLGMPWRVAFALQADGWYLRSDIIWAKPNPMPESVTDRPTKAHEYVFLLAKSERYFYDADAIREPHAESSNRSARQGLENLARRLRDKTLDNPNLRGRRQAPVPGEPNAFHPPGRNKRTVWEIPTDPYPEAHFATFPQKLVEPCILAGTSAAGCCPECGAPWERVTEDTPEYAALKARRKRNQYHDYDNPPEVAQFTSSTGGVVSGRITSGWRATCAHGRSCPVCNAALVWSPLPTKPATVLDIFSGSGTTLLVGPAPREEWNRDRSFLRVL